MLSANLKAGLCHSLGNTIQIQPPNIRNIRKTERERDSCCRYWTLFCLPVHLYNLFYRWFILMLELIIGWNLASCCIGQLQCAVTWLRRQRLLCCFIFSSRTKKFKPTHQCGHVLPFRPWECSLLVYLCLENMITAFCTIFCDTARVVFLSPFVTSHSVAVKILHVVPVSILLFQSRSYYW